MENPEEKYSSYYVEIMDWRCPECGSTKPIYKYFIDSNGDLKGFYCHCRLCNYNKKHIN